MSFLSGRLRSALILVLLVSSLWLNQAWAQGRQSGEIRGTVTDQSQAVLPGVKVTITNVSTGVSHVVTTDASGVYDLPFVQVGEYSVTFARDAFKTLTRSGITLTVETITVNGTLEVGATSERVTVSGDAPLVQTESSEKNTTFTSDAVSSAPSINRSWQDLLAALPGVNPGSGENSNGGNGGNIGVNGQARYLTSWQIDGGIAMFGQSSNPNYVSNPVETIQEVSLSTANFGAEHGNGLSVFNVITKSGTNNYHGAVYEYIENDAANALNKFAQPSTTPTTRWNEYGFNLGGPIKKNKAFFFFSYERNPEHVLGPDLRSYPTTGPQPNGGQGYREGDFSALLGPLAVDGNNNPIINPCNGQQVRQGQIYDPLTTQTVTYNGQSVVCRMPFAGNIIDSSRFDPAALAIQKNFPIPNVPGAGNVNNYYSTQSNWSYAKQTMSWINGKVDYDFTSRNRVTASFGWINYDQSFTRADCSIDCAHWKGNQPQGQITDVWTLSPNVVNEFRFSLSRAYGIATNASSGAGWPSKLGLSNPAGDLFPNIWINGNLNTDIGNPDAPPAIDVETSFIESDAVTWIKGKHILKFGGEFDRWWVNTGWGTATEGGFWWGGVFTQNPYDQSLSSNIPSEGEGYADFLLGLPNQWWISINPETGGRMWSTQAFVQDEYKVKPNLTLTLGVRWVAQSGWSDVQNRISGFQPSIKNPADGSLGAMWYGGQNGHTAMTNTNPHFFAPRLGVAWSPKNDWAVRGGFGIYNIFAGQNTIAPAIAWGQGWVPAGNQWCPDSPVFQLGNRAPNWQDASGGSSNCYGPSFGIGPPLPIYPTNQNRTADLFNGLNVNYTPFQIPMEYYAEYQLDIQHQFAHGVVLDLGYVGNRGFNVQLDRDINQIRLTGPGAGTRPYPNFAQINASMFDGRANYNALQFIARKQFAHGLSFAVSYAWAKVLDTMTGGGWGGGGSSERHAGNYQNAYDMNANYGPASNDIRHTFNGSATYNLPFGNGKQFLNQGGVLNGIVGSWELSSIFHVRSGVPTTVIMGYDGAGVGSGQWRPNQIADPNRAGTVAANSNVQCQYLAGQPIPNTNLVGIAPARVHTMSSWFNPCAFTTPQAGTFGNVGRDTIYGPNWRTVDLALLKNLRLGLLGEGGELQFKLSATDVFNHPNLGLPDAVYTDGGFGQISYANTSRQLQLGAKITF